MNGCTVITAGLELQSRRSPAIRRLPNCESL